MESSQELRNPYAPPQADTVLHKPYALPGEEAEGIETDLDRLIAERRRYIARETLLQGIGLFYLLIGGIAVFLLIFAFYNGTVSLIPGGQLVLLVASTPLTLWAGWSLWKLHEDARFAMYWVVLLSVPGLAGQGTLNIVLSLLALYAISSPKGRRVLEPDYRDLIGETPYVRHFMTPWLWVVVFLGTLILGATLVAQMLFQAGHQP